MRRKWDGADEEEEGHNEVKIESGLLFAPCWIRGADREDKG